MDATNPIAGHLDPSAGPAGRASVSMWNGGGLMQLVLDGAQDAFVAIDRGGRILAWNRAAERTFGWSKPEVLGKQMAELIIPERLRAAHHAGFERRLERDTGPVLDRRIELDAMRRDGSEFPVELALSSIEVDGDRLFCGFLHDISERRAAEAATRRLAAIVGTSDHAIISRTVDGTISTWNAAAEGIYGYTADEIIGESILRLQAPGEEGGLPAQRELLEGRRVWDFETRELRKDGSLVDVCVSASPLIDDSGEVVGIASLVRDVTERKAAERAFREVQARFQRSFYAAPIGMALVATSGRFIEVNLALCGFLGRSADDLRSIDFQDLTHPDDAEIAAEQRRRVLAGESESFDAERRYVRADGSIVWGLLQASLLRDEDGEPMYFVVQVLDISARKEAREELQRYTEQLQELALTDPLSGLPSHRAFEIEVDRQLEGPLQPDRETSLVLLDVDGLGTINEREGRERGDQALRDVGSALSQITREGDFAARVGGDEFALLLPGSTEEEAREIATRVSESIASGEPGLGVSFGVAAWPHAGRTRDLLLLRADMDLYAAKPATRSAVASSTAPAVGSLDPAVSMQVERILAFAREHFGMEVAFLGELGSEVETFRAVIGGAKLGIEADGELELDGTFCQRMIDGRIGNVVSDTTADPEVASLPATTLAGVRSYIGVPVRLESQHFYGALCLLDGRVRGDLGERDVAMMDFLAELVGEILSRHEVEVATSRAARSGPDPTLISLAGRGAAALRPTPPGPGGLHGRGRSSRGRACAGAPARA